MLLSVGLMFVGVNLLTQSSGEDYRFVGGGIILGGGIIGLVNAFRRHNTLPHS